MRILIAEDNADDRRLLRYLIENKGHEVIEAEDGLDGLRMAKIHRPDLIISDALMPYMDGFQFLREVKQDSSVSAIPFIFYSATYRGDKDVDLATALGAEAYIIKPKEPLELWDEVELILQESAKEKILLPELIEEDTDYLKKYSLMVAAKLEEKVRELEVALAERRTAEEELKEAQRVAGVGNWTLERNTGAVTWSEEIYRIFDLDPKQPAPSFRDHVRILTPDSWMQLEAAVEDTCQRGEPFELDLEFVRPDGTRGWIASRGEVLQDDSGGMRLRGTALDITQRRQLEEQLHHAQRMEALGTLAGGVAHDFNNLLTVIVGYVNMIEMKTPKESQVMPYIREVLGAAERAAHLTQGLLIFSRRQPSRLRPLNINELVSGMKKMVLRIIGEDIETSVITSDAKLDVLGDYGQLEQVLMNFVTNARDAMPDGGRLAIETRPVEIDSGFARLHGFERPGGYALISFSDTGSGMEARTRERIFEPFFTTKDEGKGTGLGLSIVYGIVNQHKGHIDCFSEPGKGTTFQVYLPTVADSACSAAEPEYGPLTGGPETILLADDDENVRRLARTVLEQYGYSVIEAADGVDAVEKFLANRGRIDLLLLDVIMPKKGGMEAFEEISGLLHDAKALFMSGYNEDVIQRKGVDGKSLPLIGKPLNIREMLGKIRDLLDADAP